VKRRTTRRDKAGWACKLIVFGSFNCGSVPVASSTGYHHASQRPLQRGKTWFCLVAD
jgi:hypothetical protein